MAKQTAETIRKTLAHTLLWAFVALLIGAFCASYAATIGGRQRDHVVLILIRDTQLRAGDWITTRAAMLTNVSA